MIVFYHISRHNHPRLVDARGRDMVPPVLAEERRSRLLELVRVRGFAALPDLVESLQVSESTIRRDLDYLEESGTAKRTHGGVFYTGSSPKLPHFDERQPAQWDRKRLI